jgi:tetratricopeptide (TPR) repeat protein
MTSVPEPFGLRLRALRTAQGISLSELARRLYYSKGHVSRIETGAQVPSAEFVRRCDAELDAKGTLIATMSTRSPVSRPEPSPGPGKEEVWLMTMRPHGGSSFTPIGRREILLGGAALTAGLGLPATPLPPTANAEEQLLHHRQFFDVARGLGQIAPPSTVLPMLIGQAHALRSLSSQAAGRTSVEITGLAARTAEFAGWMAQEAGDVESAIWWTERAVQVATAAGDDYMASYALVRRALITLYQGDATTTIALARRAQERPDVPARIVGLAAQREAQGHALAGDYDRCFRALDKAARLLHDARLGQQEGPVIGTSHVSDPVAIVTGWCLYDLGRPAAAAAVLDREIERIPASALRARTRYGARQALAHAAAGELEHACGLARTVVDQAPLVGSATILTDVRRLATMLRRWSSHPAVRALEPALTVATVGPSAS